MKKLIAIMLLLFAATSITLVNCSKENTVSPATNEQPAAVVKKEMKVSQVKDSLGIDMITMDQEYSRSHPAAAQQAMAKGKKPLKADDIVVVWFNDLTLTESGGIVTCTVSPNAYIAGVQNFVSITTNDGAVAIWECERYYSVPPGAGITTSCSTVGAGFYRGFTTDFVTYAIHVSEFLSL